MSVRSFVVITLVSGLVGAGAVAVPAAAATPEATPAAACSWQPEALQTGHRVKGASLKNSGPNGYLVGLLTPQDRTKALPVVWHGKVPTVLPDPAGWYPYPQAVNGRGDVAGFLSPAGQPAGKWKAFLASGGTYTILPSPAGVTAWATEVNSAGDVVGHLDTGPTTPPQLVLWPADAPQTYRIITTGFAVGFDDARRIITFDGRIISANGSVARISGSANDKVEKYAGGRLVGGVINVPGNPPRKEWDITGAYVRDFPGYRTHAVSAAGLVTTGYRLPFGGDALMVTDNGQPAGWAPWDSVGLTDHNELYGTIRVETDAVYQPTVWKCVLA